MSYTVTDLIDKFIQIEQSGYEMYRHMSEVESGAERVKTLARVFANEELRHVEIFKKLKADISEEADTQIDVFIYDKAAKFIYEFINGYKAISPQDIRSMLEFCLNFEKENLALIISVQGIFAGDKSNLGFTVSGLLDEIAKEEEKHAKNIEAFL